MSERWFAARINVIPVPIKFLEQGAHPYSYAIKNLVKQEFPAYCPLVYERRIWRNRRVEVPVPNFRSYLFVLFDLAELRWRKVNSTRGVTHLLPTHAEQPQPLPEGFVDGLRVAEAAREAAAIVEVVHTFAANAIVRILAGALQGRHGRVLSSSRQTTRVEVELFGREVTATVGTEELEEVDPDY